MPISALHAFLQVPGVSSGTSTPSGSPGRSTTMARRSSQTASASPTARSKQSLHQPPPLPVQRAASTSPPQRSASMPVTTPASPRHRGSTTPETARERGPVPGPNLLSIRQHLRRDQGPLQDSNVLSTTYGDHAVAALRSTGTTMISNGGFRTRSRNSNSRQPPD